MIDNAGEESVLEQAARWCSDGRRVALATVIATWGSSPRPVGSQMAIADSGALVGSVSGGCVEAVVVHQAQAAIADGEARVVRFGVSDERAWEVGLACGGRLEVYIEAVG